MPPIECKSPPVRRELTEAAERARWSTALARLVQLPDDKLAAIDIAELNLFCAAGLPGAESLDHVGHLRKIDDWTCRVRGFTAAIWHRFLKSPGEYGHSPGHFKILAMVTVLQRDFGVRYYLPFSEGEYNGSDPRSLFLHGVLSPHGGTCLTMPVLYIAVGRRLGYPLSLVRAKEHYFVRWEDEHERFNIEATTQGFSPRDDEFYRRWPKPLFDPEIAAGVFLRSLRTQEELATFLHFRSSCLLYNLRIPEALSAVRHAAALSPTIFLVTFDIIILSALVYAMALAQAHAQSLGRNSIDLRELSFPKPKNDQQKWAAFHALEKLRKVLRVSVCDPVIPLPI